MNKTTLVLGASLNPDRISHMAVLLLQEAGIPHIALGQKTGAIGSSEVITEQQPFHDIDTVTLYLGARNQTQEVVDYIVSLKPRRVIFNPGTEHFPSMKTIRDNDIVTETACTLVMLKTGQYF